jgi:hypothetical protein
VKKAVKGRVAFGASGWSGGGLGGDCAILTTASTPTSPKLPRLANVHWEAGFQGDSYAYKGKAGLRISWCAAALWMGSHFYVICAISCVRAKL